MNNVMKYGFFFLKLILSY